MRAVLIPVLRVGANDSCHAIHYYLVEAVRLTALVVRDATEQRRMRRVLLLHVSAPPDALHDRARMKCATANPMRRKSSTRSTRRKRSAAASVLLSATSLNSRRSKQSSASSSITRSRMRNSRRSGDAFRRIAGPSQTPAQPTTRTGRRQGRSLAHEPSRVGVPNVRGGQGGSDARPPQHALPHR